MTKDQAYRKLGERVEQFKAQIEYYKKSTFNETQTRSDFINPFFQALGWDMNNSRGLLESQREVIQEDRIRNIETTLAPDYSFWSESKRLFFVEAKKPYVSILDNPAPAYQVRRYGWTAQLPISIVTDFEEFGVYDCTLKPSLQDSAKIARLQYLRYDTYLDQFDYLWDTFAKENVIRGSLERLASSNFRRGISTVDEEFLRSLEGWRNYLAIDVVRCNQDLSEEQINYAVQQTLDRIIFLRISEDRYVEPYGNLRQVISHGNYYQRLLRQFKEANDKYNSGLFDFRKDNLTPKLAVSNHIIEDIINDLYNSPYAFQVMPVEILGSVYERFLGKQIKIDTKRAVSIVEKPEVYKAGGVYYTPQYIVNFITSYSISKLLNGKTPKQVSQLKFADMACGSGSFLLGVYQILLDWHLQYYLSDATKAKKDKALTVDGRLATALKKNILLSNIYGVDIDAQAVEVTKLSLLLKCLEGETEASINQQLNLYHERILPTLDENIKNGNSLIDFDFNDATIDFNPLQDKKIKPFNWKAAFPAVFEQGGFDCILGNPPYGAELTSEERKYLARKYPYGSTDTAALFMIRSQELLKGSGITGFIVPKAFTFSSSWEGIRARLMEDVVLVADCSKVWPRVKLEMSIYIHENGSRKNSFESYVREDKVFKHLGLIEKELCKNFGFILNGVDLSEVRIGLKIKANGISLNSLVTNQRGAMIQNCISKNGNLQVLGGKQINRFSITEEARGFISSELIKDLKAFIKPNSILVQNIVAHVQNPKPRVVITATMLKEVEQEKKYVILDTINQLENISTLDIRYLLGVLNSNAVSWYAYRFIFANAIRTMHFDATTTEKVMFPALNLNDTTHKAIYEEIISLTGLRMKLGLVNKLTLTPAQMEQFKARTQFIENKINYLVYQLFGLNEFEVKTIECQINSHSSTIGSLAA